MATPQEIRAIINRIGPYAQKYAQKYGYHVCSPCIAQALQESLGKYEGLSLLAYKYRNYHGIKTYPKWKGASVNLKTGEEYTTGAITHIQSNFCVFESEEDAIEQYYLFLERNPRYRNLKACLTAEDYLQKIKADGYCTSSTYVANCISKINSYDLKSFDNFTYKPSKPDSYYTVGVTYTLDANLYIRFEPFGEKVKYECITHNAKENAKFDDYGCAILKKGTRVTCLDVKELTGSTWLLIPSGWVCAVNDGKVYIK